MKRVSDDVSEIKKILPFDVLFNELYPSHCQGRSSLCPFHDDQRNSFEVHADHGFCHAGCTPGNGSKSFDVISLWMQHQGVEFKQAVLELCERCGLSTEKPLPRNASPEAVYDYCDENGELLFQVCRYPGKQFRQRKPDPDKPGEWIWSLHDTRRVLFGLPELVAADPDAPVLVCEGEKDCLAAKGLGFVTTCNPGGAGKWPSLCEGWKIHEPLKGRICWIVPDNDEPGRKHADDIARSLVGFARSVKILTLPGLSGKQDLTDFVEKHGSANARAQTSGLADSTPEYVPRTQPDDWSKPDSQEKPSKFTKCLETFRATGSDVFLDQHKSGWATVRVGETYQNIRLSSSAFNRNLGKLFVDTHEEGISKEIISQVAGYLEACATETRHLYNRFAWQDDRLLIDMGTRDWAALEITADGHRIMYPASPIFRRFPHQEPLPKPESGGSVADILPFLPITNSDDQILIQIWLVTALLEHIPRPLINIHGSHGGGKSYATTLLRALVDPSSVPSHCLSKDHAEFIQCLDHNAVLVIDNIHRLPQSFSDDLSRAVTGTGFLKRSLYKDDDDFIYQFRRVMILAGINSPATSPDLLDRSITIRFERISEDERKEERRLASAFEQARPRIFGAMVQALSTAMGIVDSIHLDRYPRMADWTRWGCAVAEALKVGQEQFLQAYYRNMGTQNDEIVGSEPVCIVLTEFMNGQDLWTGRPAELYSQLLEIAKKQHLEHEKAWPKATNALSRRLSELQHNLRDAGLMVERSSKGRDRGKARTIMISRTPIALKIPTPSTDRPQSAPKAVPTGNDMGTTPEPLMNIDRRIDPSNPPESQNGDDGDSGDDISRTLLRFDLEKCDSCKDLFMGSCQRTGKNLNDMQECPNHEGRVNEGWNF